MRTASTENAADLSILLVADSLEMVRKVLRGYAAENGGARLEIVIARLGGAEISEAELRAHGFAEARVIEGGDGELAVAEAKAVRAATAPFVVFAQAHAYPQPGYGRAIVEAARSGRWTVVGPSIENANPESALSRAALRIGYGLWWGARARGVVETVPGHSSAYDRAALMALGDDLEKALTAGRQLQLELRERGGTVFYEPAARVAIVNVSRLVPFLADQLRQGRLVAGERSRRWTMLRRAGYAAGAPLIPVVRLARILSNASRAGQRRPGGAELLALLAGLAAGAAGELAGYLFGKSPRATSHELSFHRLRYASAADRRRDEDETRWPRTPGATSDGV